MKRKYKGKQKQNRNPSDLGRTVVFTCVSSLGPLKAEF